MDQQVVLDFARFTEEFHKNKTWGEIRVVFRQGVPMSIASTVQNQIRGPEQAAVIKGEKPYVKEYR